MTHLTCKEIREEFHKFCGSTIIVMPGEHGIHFICEHGQFGVAYKFPQSGLQIAREKHELSSPKKTRYNWVR